MAEHSKAITRKAEMLPAPIVTLVQSVVPDCTALLPPDISSEQFRAGLWLELTGRPALASCSLDSLRTCIVQAANDGMLPGRDTHFLPFSVKGQSSKRATKVDNYHGLQRALERTGKVARSWAAPVCEGDTWEFDRFMDRPRHLEAMTLGHKPGRELFYYGAVLFKDGTCAFEPISLEELAAIERSASAHDSGPWKDWPQMMKRKSALKRVCKYVPVTPQVQALLEADDERLQTDIPPERHRANIVDLYGDDPRGSTPQHTAQDAPGSSPPAPDDAIDPRTGELLPTARTDGYSPSWRETLVAHQDNVQLPDALRAKVRLALHPGSQTTDEKGFALASAILDCVDQACEQAAAAGQEATP